MDAKPKLKKLEPPLQGFAMGATVLLIGLSLLYIPVDLGLTGFVSLIFIGLGVFLISISLSGSFNELSKLVRNQGQGTIDEKPTNYWIAEGLNWIAAGLFFLVIALGIQLAIINDSVGAEWITLGKFTRIVLAVIGVGMFIYALPYFLAPVVMEVKSDPSIQGSLEATHKRKVRIAAIINVTLILVSAIADILGIWQFIRSLSQ